jgi:predicted nucleotidyltransferase
MLRKAAIDYFLDKLEEKPIIAFIFGSTAKGTAKKDSDIDILLIVNKKIKTEEASRYVGAQTGIRMSIFQIDYNNFKLELKTKEDKVIASAISTGFPATNHIQYYREVLKEWK